MRWVRAATDGLRRSGGAIRRSAPVLGLELRAASRRRGTYLLRIAYLAALALFVVLIWAAATAPSARPASGYARSRMSEAGRQVTAQLLWFLFAAGPVTAVILMCNAFTAELRHGALATLMSTPLSCGQIVVGKFLSRFAQLLVLLVATLPVLAVVRIFGGVPWGFILAGTGVAVSISAFAGALSLAASIRLRDPHKTMVYALVIAGVLAWPVGRGLVEWSDMVLTRPGWFEVVVLPAGPFVYGVVGTAVCLALAAHLLRKHARLALGNEPRRPRRLARPGYLWLPPVPDDPVAAVPVQTPPPPDDEALAAMKPSITGSPIAWRALRRRLMPGVWRGALLAGVLMAYTYAFAGTWGWLSGPSFHTAAVAAVLLVTVLLMALASSSAVTAEKESGCWALLLAVPLTDRQLLAAEMGVVLRRTYPGLAIVAVHAVAFVLAGVFHPVALLHLAAAVGSAGAFVMGLGLYASVRLRRTTTAVLVTVGLLAGLWGLLPWTLVLLDAALSESFGTGRWLTGIAVLGSPFVQVRIAIEGAMGRLADPSVTDELLYSWHFRTVGLGRFTAYLSLWAAGHLAAGGVLAWRAMRRFRREPF